MIGIRVGLRIAASVLLIAPCLTGQAQTAVTRVTAIPPLGRVPTDCSTGAPRTVLGKVYGADPSVVGYGAFPVAGLLRWASCHATVQPNPPHAVSVLVAALRLDTQDAVVHETQP